MAASDKPTSWVTLITCRNLSEADLIAAELRAAQLPVLIPDELIAQNGGGITDIRGFIRVQVQSKDYDAAREFLPSPEE